MLWLSFSAPFNRRSENVVIETVIISELEFSDVQRHIFLADLVIAADDAALEDRPEAFNRVGVDCADHVGAASVVDHGMQVFLVKDACSLPNGR
jgi:hypothetical protein